MTRLAIVAVIAASIRIANAQPTQELTREFQAGVDAFRLGNYDEARAHTSRKPSALDPKLPGPHRFLAAVAQAQGRWQDCIDFARKALELNPQSQEVTDTRKLHDECRVGAGKAPYRGDLGDSAAIAVTSNVTGATVKIGGLTYGATPLAPRPITAGALEIDVEKAGWKPVHLSVNALAGIVTDVTVDLEPDPNAKVQTDLEGPKRPIKPTTGWLVLAKPARARRSSIDGKPAPIADRVELAPGTHVIEIVVEPGKDPWRRRVRISAGQKTAVAPMFVDTASREHDERIGLGVLAGGGAIVAFGFAAALISEHASADAREIFRVETARDPNKPLSETTAIEPVRTRADFEDAHVSRIAVGADLRCRVRRRPGRRGRRRLLHL